LTARANQLDDAMSALESQNNGREAFTGSGKNQNQSNSTPKTENQISFWLSQLSAKKLKSHFQTTLRPQNDQHHSTLCFPT